VLRLAEATWEEAAKVARDPRSVVLLPLGAIEQHGPHLPLLVDWLGADELARRLTPHLERSGYRVVLAPSLPYGVSTLARGWSGTVSLSIGAFRRVVGEILAELAGHGFRRFVLANYQADPDHLRGMARVKRDLERTHDIQVLFAGFAPGAGGSTAMVNPRVRALMRSPNPAREWHSGELETAVVLSVRPSLVRRRRINRLPPMWVDYGAALARGVRSFREMAPRGRGYFGWPTAARADTGRRVLTLRARLIASELITALNAWPARRPRRTRPRRKRE
jgi:creatinine amidohydrolase